MPLPVWKDAEIEFVDYFKQFGKLAHVQRLSDTAHVKATTGRKTAWKDAQPADFIVSHHGDMYYAEVKSCSNQSSFPLSSISTEQWKCAVMTTAAKGKYTFFIRDEVNFRWYAVPASFLIEHQASTGLKSAKWELLQRFQWKQVPYV